MAIDGVKIIDSDLAHDTYWGIMDLYDSGIDFAHIEERFPLNELDYFDDVDNEIYITTCALAYWEVGKITPEMLLLVKTVIEKGAGVELWTENSDKEGKARKRELESFLKKVSQENHKIRKPKIYRKITNLIFQPDTVLAFQLENGSYRALICIDVMQRRGVCTYVFAQTTYNSAQKPTTADILEVDIIGRTIDTGYNRQEATAMQPGIERIWQFLDDGDEYTYFFGISQIWMDHKNLIHFSNRFENIGSLKILPGLKEMGSITAISSFEDIRDKFANPEKPGTVFGDKKYPTIILCEE